MSFHGAWIAHKSISKRRLMHVWDSPSVACCGHASVTISADEEHDLSLRVELWELLREVSDVRVIADDVRRCDFVLRVGQAFASYCGR